MNSVANDVAMAERPSTVDEVIAAYRHADAWIRGCLKPGQRTRLDDYARVCDRLSGLTHERWSQQDVLCTMELEDLVSVWRRREQLQAMTHFEARVRCAAGGEKFYADDAEHNSRNILFELLCACFLVDLGAQLVSGGGDIAAHLETWWILAECKRPNGRVRSFLRRVREASRQIAELRTEHEIGVVFVDLTVGVNRDLDHIAVSNDAEAAMHMRSLLQGNAAILHDRALATLGSPLDAFIACRLTMPFWVAPELRWVVHCRWISFANPRAAPEAVRAYERLDALAMANLHAGH